MKKPKKDKKWHTTPTTNQRPYEHPTLTKPPPVLILLRFMLIKYTVL